VARRWKLGLTLVLHTWGQTLEHHIHVHGIVTGGALAQTARVWIATKRRDFLFPVKGLAKVFGGNISRASTGLTPRELCALQVRQLP